MILSVVIVNYNVKYFLEQCLASVMKAAEQFEHEVWVVDNNSSDGSVEYLQPLFPSVNFIANKHNPGFSKANNQAITLCKGEYILILNPDTVVAENTFEICINAFKNLPKVGAMGVKMVDGKGVFLPESKRAIPTPSVAFCKIFGLSALFPTSPVFGKYHLGFLSKNENHSIEILSGAFMFFRKKVLDEIGYFDETFFMYGEDIDLSYRVIQAGYENYYLADTTIIHYKGESTKKGSLNYVRVFYQAMIIFAEKHFAKNSAKLYAWLINLAVVFKALLTLLLNILSSSYLLLIDFLISLGALILLTNFWSNNIKNAVAYYPQTFKEIVLPSYLLIWIGTVFMNGGYEKEAKFSSVFRGVIFSTILIAALYGLLPDDFRFSRAIILLGGAVVGFCMLSTRLIYNVLKNKKFTLHFQKEAQILFVGKETEINQLDFILKSSVNDYEILHTTSDGNVKNLKENIQLFEANEIIFSPTLLSYETIISLIEKLGEKLEYKILQKNSSTLIGSNSKNTAGDLQNVYKNYSLAKPIVKRKKRILDISLSLIVIIFAPYFFLFSKNKILFFQQIGKVLSGKKTWIGYLKPFEINDLPKISEAVFSFKTTTQLPSEIVSKLNHLYAKHWQVGSELRYFLKMI